MAMLTYEPSQRRTPQQIMSLVDASVDYTKNIAYKSITVGEASDVYATDGVVYMSPFNTMNGDVPPLRFSKKIVKNKWNLQFTFYKLIDFLLDTHFHWNGPCYFFVEIPLPS